MSPLRILYLVIAFVGAAYPTAFIVRWVLDNGFDLAGLYAAWTTNLAATGLFWDLMISGAALTLWILAEVAVRRNWEALMAIPAMLLFGVSCGLPLYLFLRTRPVQ